MYVHIYTHALAHIGKEEQDSVLPLPEGVKLTSPTCVYINV